MHRSFYQKLQCLGSEFFLTAIWSQNNFVCALAIILCTFRNISYLWLVVIICEKQTQEEEKLCWINKGVWGIERLLIYFVQKWAEPAELGYQTYLCIWGCLQWKILDDYQYFLGKGGHIIQILSQRPVLSTKKPFLKRQLFSSLAHLWRLLEVGHSTPKDHHKVQRR